MSVIESEPCSICEYWIRGISCEQCHCPVDIMKRENAALKEKISRLESDRAYDLENRLSNRIYEMGEC